MSLIRSWAAAVRRLAISCRRWRRALRLSKISCLTNAHKIILCTVSKENEYLIIPMKLFVVMEGRSVVDN
jgi:hypothetical protein